MPLDQSSKKQRDLQGLSEVGNEVGLAIEPADDLLRQHVLLVGSLHPVCVILVVDDHLSQIHYLNPLQDLNESLAQFIDRICTVNSVN